MIISKSLKGFNTILPTAATIAHVDLQYYVHVLVDSEEIHYILGFAPAYNPPQTNRS